MKSGGAGPPPFLPPMLTGVGPGFSERGSEHRGVSLMLGGTAPQKL